MTLHIMHVNLAKGFRGGERQTELLIQALANSGLKQLLVCRSDSPLRTRLQGTANLSFLNANHQLMGHWGAPKVDLIHAHEAKAVHWAWLHHCLRGTPYILTRRVPQPVKDNSFNQRCYRNACMAVAISSPIEQHLNTHQWCPVQRIPSALAHLKHDPEIVAILRATYTNNQLQEVLTDFWFNHFNVSIAKNQCAQFIPVFERDAIRPNVLGNFNQLVMATAKSPAMLLYLDNFSSAGMNEDFENRVNNYTKKLARLQKDTSEKGKKALQQLNKTKSQGLNENYAREVMELHTLGVDGGYTQNDVTQAAKVLTGWTVYPISDYGPIGNMKKIVEKFGEEKLSNAGFVHQGDFLFTINRHDVSEKTVLGKKFPAGRGLEEGEELLNMLAIHASTAKFISKKLAIRFVSDNPPQSLLDKMTNTFIKSKGNIRDVLITMVTAPEFWTKEALREKTKSPFELVVSTVRIMDAHITQPFQLNNWITKMGQQIYYYQAPTGFPDRAQYWINTGALLNRMNFGLAIAAKKIPGIQFDLADLNNHKEPESAVKALEVYSKIFMPERDLTKTIQRLTPLLSDPNLMEKVNDAANKNKAPNSAQTMQEDEMTMSTDKEKSGKERVNKKGQIKNANAMNTSFSNSSMLSQVVGVIIGSPEFQRR